MVVETPSPDIHIIGVGLMRTGSESLQVALKRLLDVDCRRLQPNNVIYWKTALEEDVSDQELLKLFTKNRVLVCLPSTVLYKRLLLVRPNAKVILTTRDPQRWFRSVHSTLIPFAASLRVFPMNIITRLSGTAAIASLFEKVARRVLGKECDLNDKGHMLDSFERHVEEVKETVPADQLLVYDVKDGWPPLCEFLGVKQPLEAFPHVNQGYEFRRWARKRVRLELMIALFGVVFLTWGLYRFASCLTSTWTYFPVSVNHDEI